MTREEIDALWDRVAHRYGVDQREPDWAVLRALPVDAVATGIEGRMQISLDRGIVATGGYVRQAALEAVAPPQVPLQSFTAEHAAQLAENNARAIVGLANQYAATEAMREMALIRAKTLREFAEVIRRHLNAGLPAEPGTRQP